jgi:sucrose-6-phosphate hydrolase SacC (GH32 family)
MLVMVVYDEKEGKNAAFYTSTNLKDWTEQSHLPGYFECTDLIKLPVDGDANNPRWVVYAADARYAVGQFDGTKFTPEHESKYQVHFGAYYAAQTFDNSSDGRRIQIGWVQVRAPGPYNQHFSFPHCLTLHKTGDGIRMFAAPIKEIETLRSKTNKAEPQKLVAGKPVDLPVGSDLLDIRLTVEVGNAGNIELNIPGETIKYDVQGRMLDVPMQMSEVGRRVKGYQGAPLTPVDGIIKLQVLVDRSLVEVAGNDGRVYITSTGPGRKMDVAKISVTATGGDAKLVEFEAHELNSIWK